MPMKNRCRLGRRAVLAVLAAAVFFCSGCSWRPWTQPAAAPGNKADYSAGSAAIVETAALPSSPLSANMVSVDLYFKDPQKNKLVLEKRQIPRAVGIARATMEELFKGPANAGLESPFPPGTELLDINLRADGVCIVDISRQIRGAGNSGASGEKLAVYAVVNTLTQFPTVKKVKILVEGQQLKTLAGGVAISEPLTRDSSLISQ